MNKNNSKDIVFWLIFIICYFQLQKLVVGGELPCSKEDVATLASIQLHIEEAWPEENLPNYTKSDLALFNKKLLDSHKYLSKSTDPQENLRRRKELIRNNRALRITQSRRKGRLVRQLTCVSDHEENSHSDVDLSQFLPPDFTTSKKIRYIIQVCVSSTITLWWLFDDRNTSYSKAGVSLRVANTISFKLVLFDCKWCYIYY